MCRHHHTCMHALHYTHYCSEVKGSLCPFLNIYLPDMQKHEFMHAHVIGFVLNLKCWTIAEEFLCLQYNSLGICPVKSTVAIFHSTIGIIKSSLSKSMQLSIYPVGLCWTFSTSQVYTTQPTTVNHSTTLMIIMPLC